MTKIFPDYNDVLHIIEIEEKQSESSQDIRKYNAIVRLIERAKKLDAREFVEELVKYTRELKKFYENEIEESVEEARENERNRFPALMHDAAEKLERVLKDIKRIPE